MQKPFNAINGLEALKLVMADIERMLSLDGRFRQNLTYHQLSFSVAVQVRTFPVDAGSFEAQAQGVVGRAPAGATPLAVPPVPVIGAPEAVGHLQPERTEVVPAAPPAISDEAFEAELQRRGLGRTPAEATDASLLDRSPRPAPAPVAETVIDETDLRPNPKTLPVGGATTSAGEPITGGAQEPDGAVLDIARRHREAFEASQRSPMRPGADQAENTVVVSERVVWNPNEARREVGLPVPEPRRVDGNVVDVARDQF